VATIAETLAAAMGHYQGGRLQPAEQICWRILQMDPNHAGALHLLGVIAFTAGKVEIAIEYIGRALQLQPDSAETNNNLAGAFIVQGNLDEAVGCCRRALALNPHFAEAHNNLGLALSRQNKLDEAIACFRQAIALKPDFSEPDNNLGNALRELGYLDEAIAWFRQAIALKPDFAEAHFGLGVALSDQGNQDKAISSFRRALALKADFAEVHGYLGYALRKQGKVDEAVDCFRQAVALKPEHADAHNNLGVALSDQGNLDEAAACFRQAVALKWDCADAHVSQSLLTLLRGDLRRGLAEYEWRWKSTLQRFRRHNFAQPLWGGEPLAGRTILLHAEQGLGDTIQFIRYVPLVKERGGRVVVECQRLLLPLLANVAGIDQLLALGDLLPPFDVQAPLLSIPGIMGTTLDTIPARVPYLAPDPERVQSWRKQLEPLGGFRVGIVWQGDPQMSGDALRSILLRYFEPLARVPEVRLVSLQKGAGANQLLTVSFPVIDLGSRLETFSDTAAVLKNLDLVISSCTSVPHLAGALGVPVWLALPFVPDWRWLLEREDSPWYPRHRLFRQSRLGDWGEVFNRIATALSSLVVSRNNELS
jgi:tetratricopeptide (TPR) repeat protein